MRLAAVLALLLVGGPALAAPPILSFPGPATRTAAEEETATTIRIPTGPWAVTGLPTRLAEGTVSQTAWRIAGASSTRDLIAALQRQLSAQGWQMDFSCETDICGGFDFRYGLPLLTEPDMHVDLADFRFLTASKGPASLMLMVSRASGAGFVQLTLVSPNAAAEAPVLAPAVAETAPDTTPDLAARLETEGSVVLNDLDFGSGSATLAPDDYASLRGLAAYLAAHPTARVVLVGHTDASGALAANIALSRARAQAVRKALVALGAAADRIEADGAGYLAPRASNLTAEGRAQNRRVEVMLTPTQLDAP